MEMTMDEASRDLRTDVGHQTSVIAGIAGVALALAGVKLLIHLLTTGAFGYGYFVDELYYLAVADHLSWGFVDMPPLFPAITAVIVSIFGNSLFAVRIVPTLAGAALVLMTARVARRLGGGVTAQGLSALAVLTGPIWLVMHSISTMNALEQLFWTGGAWILIRILDEENDRLWLAFGLLAGVGLLNKHSMVFFGAAVVVGLLATRYRSALGRRWFWLGGLIAFVIFLPNLIWMIDHGFPHLEQLANIREDQRNVALSPWQFIHEQIEMVGRVSLPLWIAGIVWLFRVRQGRFRPLAWLWPTVLVEMLFLDGRTYYMAPVYPVLLAAGGCAIESWLARFQGRRLVIGTYAAAMVAWGVLIAPMFLPVLPPSIYVNYTRAIGIEQPRIENHELGPLPQLFADRFGWKEMAEVVAKVYYELPPEDQKKAAIFGQNYGQAGAIDLFGPELGLPKAVSGHLTYHMWGPREFTGEVVVVMEEDRETLEQYFESVEYGGRVEHPLSMPYEHFDVWVCRDMKQPLAEIWPALKHYD